MSCLERYFQGYFQDICQGWDELQSSCSALVHVNMLLANSRAIGISKHEILTVLVREVANQN